MKLPPYIKSKTAIGNFIPLIGNQTSQTIYPFIFLSKHVYDNLQSNNPNPHFIAHLAHEETHRQRQKQAGILIYLARYIISPKFRFSEELESHKESMKIFKKYHLHYDLDKHAKFLSSYVYLWAISQEYARKELKKAWDN